MDRLRVMSQPPARLSRNLSFHFLWSSTFASGFGDRLAMLCFAVMMGQGVTSGALSEVRLADASIIAAINFWFFLPYVIWGPIAGWLADRLPRKWLMFTCDEARGVLILIAYMMLPAQSSGAVPGMYETWVTVAGVELPHTWKVWALMFSIGMFASTFSPARNSVIPNVVGMAALQRANAVVLGMGVIGNLFGFLVGGPLSETMIRMCIFACAMAYLLPGWMWPFLRTPAVRHAHHGPKGIKALRLVFTDVADGGLYIFRHRPLLKLVCTFILFWTGSQVIMAAGSAIAVHLYGGKIGDFALIGGGFGVGMLSGALLLGLINSRKGGEIIITAGLLSAAPFLSLLVVVPNKMVGLGLAVVLGMTGGMLMITINTMLQQLTADGFRGRVMAFKDLAGDVGGVLINLVIWQMADADRHIITLAHVFAVSLVIAAVYGVRQHVVRGPMRTGLQNLLWRVTRLYCQALHRLRVTGAHRVPREGPVLLVANHIAGTDPLLVQAALPRLVRWMMARDMMKRSLGWAWRAGEVIGVNRDGNDRAAMREAIEVLCDGQVVGIFPEGQINEEPSELMAFQPGLALIAEKADALIVPVYISGMRPGLGPWKPLWRLSRSRVVFGEPVSVEQLKAGLAEADDRHAALSGAIRDRVLALADCDIEP